LAVFVNLPVSLKFNTLKASWHNEDCEMDFKVPSSTPQMLFEVLGPGKLCLMMTSWHTYLKKPLFYKH